MRQYSIGSRYIALLLLVAMIFSMVPAMQFEASADYERGDTVFVNAADEGITMIEDADNISLSIKVNNFVLDGMLFDYLSSTRAVNNAHDYLWEKSMDNGKSYIQLYPYKVYNDIFTSSRLGNFADADGFSNGTLNEEYCLDATSNTTDVYGVHSTLGSYQRTLTPNPMTQEASDEGRNSDYYPLSDQTPFIRLYPRQVKWDYYGNNATYSKGRGWIKLTTFTKTMEVDAIRYAVVVYRLPNGNNGIQSTMALTINSFDEANGNRSAYVPVDTAGSKEWQYAIIDLMGLGFKDARGIVSGTDVNTVYLQAPINWNSNTTYYMDIAAVGYFPYYGDAEQFAYYGLTLGCAQKYFNADNASFSLRNATKTSNSTVTNTIDNHVKSIADWWADEAKYNYARQVNINTFSNGVTQTQELENIANLIDNLGNNLFGDIAGQASLGLIEEYLDENGLPVYKESTVNYLATYLRHRLMTVPEYPDDNNGWRNYSYVTGSSTSGGTNEALFGTNALGQSIDLGTAICKALGVEKSGAVVSGKLGSFGGGSNGTDYKYSDSTSGKMGTYAETYAKRDQLIGTWKECVDNIDTWFDAAYYLLHNLYVTEEDVADAAVDGYGDYEDTYQSLILPQVRYTTGEGTTTPYFFDSGYAYNTSYDSNGDGDYLDDNDRLYTTALTFDKNNHTISLNTDAEGKAKIMGDAATQTFASYFPFLVTSGNGTKDGESNIPYYLHGGALESTKYGLTYNNRDFHYALSGRGYFAYEDDLYFNFEGDDDVYVFINGQLVVDLGGTHGAATYNMDLDEYVEWAWNVKNGNETYKGNSYGDSMPAEDKARVDALCLVTGGVYSFDFFYMERHGIGSNLRIMTNMKIVESGLDVDKFAYQNEVEVEDNGVINADQMIEYGFSLTNNSDGKLYDLSFVDPVIGVSLDPDNGLQVTGNVTDADGVPLTASGLVITVDGYELDENDELVAIDHPISITCPNNEALIKFLKTLEATGTESGNLEDDYHLPYEGSGLWKDATVTIRGIYYTMTDAQKAVNSFTNSVSVTGFAKVANENGSIGDYALRGTAKHTVYQPGKPYYYQWVGHPIVIESERLYNDLIGNNIVASADELPNPADMILIPSNAGGDEIDDVNMSNVPGGDVYLKVNFTTPGSHMAYVTIRDATDATYSMTVPITIYAVGGQDSAFVLDYGLDTYLTENDALFDYEIGEAATIVDGSLLGIADDSVTPTYKEYDEEKIESAAGQIANGLELVYGSYDSATETHTTAVYKLDKPVFLDHNKPWVIEWRSKFDNALLFSSMETSGAGNTYIYASGDNGGLYIGEHAEPHFTINGQTGNKYNNYGIKNANAFSTTTVKTYSIVNEPDGSGGNTIYLYVDGVKIGAMEGYHIANTAYANDSSSNPTNADWVSGRDFTFNYMGTKGHPLDGVYNYIRVYEDGYQLTHYNWELEGTAGSGTLASVNTNRTGFVDNSIIDRDALVNRVFWTLEKPVSLAHDESWEITFIASGITGPYIMSSADIDAINATGIRFYDDGDDQLVLMGYRNEDGDLIYYGLNIRDVISGFKISGSHTYVLKNAVSPNGNNMVHLYVDDTYIGALDAEYDENLAFVEENTNISGIDFTFKQIGNKYGRFPSNSTISGLYVRSKTTLNNSYEWVPGASGLVSTVATDDTGNQIVFYRDEDGAVVDGAGSFTLDSKGLKFEVNEIMDDRYTAYVALAIHDKGFTPTAIEIDGIDIGHEAQMYKKVTILPANVVYYEDDFPAIHYYGTEVDSFTDLGNVSTDSSTYTDTKYYGSGSSEGLTQSPDQDTPYGSDNAYQNILSNSSGDSLHTIAINNDGPLAWFQFKGTGFGIEARTSATQAGMIFVEVYNAADVVLDASNNNYPKIGQYGFIECKSGASAVEIIPVNPQFDQGNIIDGSFEAINGGAEAIYQVPVIRYDEGAYGDYIVVISGVENLDYDNNMAHIDSYLYLDGIRIYNPLDQDVEEYGNEKNVVFEEIRSHIVDGNILVCDYSSDGVIASSALTTWTEKYNNQDYSYENTYVGYAVSDVNDYLMDGPNNEVYLDGTFTSGAIAFYVRPASANDILQIGVRALDAGLYYGAATTGMRANLSIGVIGNTNSGTVAGWHHVATVSSGTEQYYTIPYTYAPVVTIDGMLYYQVVLKVDSFSDDIPAMVSFTNIKRSEGMEIYEGEFTAADKTVDGNLVIEEQSTGYNLLRNLSYQMSAYRSFTINEAEPGANFVVNDTNNNEDEIAPAIIPTYPTLSFEGEVRYNIYFDIENLDDVALEDMGLITFDSKLFDGTIADATDVIPGALTNGVEYMVHTNGIPAKNLGDMVYFKVYAKLADGTYVYSDLQGYNAIYYAEYILANTDSAEMKSLVVATLNYGAAAQEFFGYKTDSLMNAGLTAEQQALASAYSTDMVTDIVIADRSKAGQFTYTGGFSNMYPTVSFDGAFTINYYFTPDKAMDGEMTMYYWDAETYNSVSELTAENAIGKQTMTENTVNAGEYVGFYTGMAAKEIGETVYVAIVYEANEVTYCSGIVSYSIDYYCAEHAANNASEMQELAAATTVYGFYAKEYFA